MKIIRQYLFKNIIVYIHLAIAIFLLKFSWRIWKVLKIISVGLLLTFRSATTGIEATKTKTKLCDNFLWLMKVLNTRNISEYELVKRNHICSHLIVLISTSDWHISGWFLFWLLANSCQILYWVISVCVVTLLHMHTFSEVN